MLLFTEPIPRAWQFRIVVLAILGLLGFGFLATRLYTMQVVETEHHERLARYNTVVVERVTAPRGRMYDAKGRLVVSSQPMFELYVIPAETPRRHATVQRLARELGLQAGPLLKKIEDRMRKAPLEPLTLARNLTQAQLSRAAALAEELPGVFVGVHGQRKYPHGKAAAHVFGHMGEINADELRELRREGYSGRDMIGKDGLDRTYDRMLRGRKGLRHLYVDATGKTVGEVEERKPVAGLDLHLTLDMSLQLEAEKALQETLDGLRYKNGEQSSGAVVAMNPRTGAVLAMASLPQYDPRPFARGIKPEEYRALLAAPGDPLVDRAAHAAFSPGSTFKPLSASAALQEGLVWADSVFHCAGSYKGANCFVTSGHGAISLRESIAQSCDVVYYMLADRMGIRKLNKYLSAFGLGKATGIDLPGEETGLLPTPEWKKKYLEDEWYGGDTINLGIGQGFLLVTPLQMATAISAIANRGDVPRPHLVDYATNHKGVVVWRNSTKPVRKLPVDPKLYQAVVEGMRGAVTHGTGTAADTPYAKAGGKTGTVESFPSVYNPTGRNHVWFECFAPVDKPEITVVVFLEKSGGYGGQYAAPIARRVLDHYFAKVKKLPNPNAGKAAKVPTGRMD